MPATYEPIASTTLSSDALFIEFTNIPSTFTDLFIVGQLRSKTAGTGANSGFLRFNSDASALYSETYLYGDGSSVSSGRQNSGMTSVRFTSLVAQASNTNRNLFTINIMSYNNTNIFKTFLYSGGLATSGVERGIGLWRSTNAITSISIARDFSTNLESGSTASLYGIKAAA